LIDISGSLDGLKFSYEIPDTSLQETPLFHEEIIHPPIDQATHLHERKKRKYEDATNGIDIKLKECKKRVNPFKIITVSSSAFTPISEKSKEAESVSITPLKIESESVLLKSPSNEQYLEMQKMIKNAKQERNRVCARECRLRKKLYLEKIEKENKMFRKQIAKYRKELNIYKAKEEARLISDVNINEMISDSIEKLRTDNNNTKELLDNYIVSLAYKSLEGECGEY